MPPRLLPPSAASAPGGGAQPPPPPSARPRPAARPAGPGGARLTPVPTTPLARAAAFAADLLRALWRFLGASAALLPQFSRPSPAEALRRLGLVLAASVVMVATVSAIDGAWLSLYLMRATALMAGKA